jgi:hypothetical protein
MRNALLGIVVDGEAHATAAAGEGIDGVLDEHFDGHSSSTGLPAPPQSGVDGQLDDHLLASVARVHRNTWAT